MPKIVKRCVDCGKERTAYPSAFNNPREKYRCHTCSLKYGKIGKKTYTCIDCGKQKTAYFRNKRPEEYRCRKCYNKKKNSIINKDPKRIDNFKKSMAKYWNDPNWRNQQSEKMSNFLKSHPEVKEKNKDYATMAWKNETYRNKHSSLYNLERKLIGQSGQGFWYGNPSLIKWNNGRRKYYCELWNRDLWNRIDASYDYKSILSGKTRFENYKCEVLTHHHLYWQEMACCEWDGDANGYYAWINNGTCANPNWVKYYIKGDPNKFVLLTRDEHGKIRGNKKLGTDKIYWIKHIEGLIEERKKQGKKCYLSKEEYEVYKIEHADTIKKYSTKSINTNST